MGLFLDFEKKCFSLAFDLQRVVNFRMGLFGNLGIESASRKRHEIENLKFQSGGMAAALQNASGMARI
jgi:hypothetical protein